MLSLEKKLLRAAFSKHRPLMTGGVCKQTIMYRNRMYIILYLTHREYIKHNTFLIEDSNCWVSATFDTNTIRFCAVGVRCFSGWPMQQSYSKNFLVPTTNQMSHLLIGNRTTLRGIDIYLYEL